MAYYRPKVKLTTLLYCDIYEFMDQPKKPVKKIISCPKCRALPSPLESCNACHGKGLIVLTKIEKTESDRTVIPDLTPDEPN